MNSNDKLKDLSPEQLAKRKKMVNIMLGVLGIIILLIIIGTVAGGSSSSGKKAKYSATVDTSNMAVINPASVSLSFKVTNTGNAPGKPQCTIQADDPSATYIGTDIVTLDNVQPGQTITSADTLTITKQGAQYITKGTISCQ